ncbi:alpha/beta hydrolase [Egibacter rhizosphaerae]|uniref:Alpha/beta hydrolase n=1 Tax=Egibacter rhizosphaerae TaxID=1670831 RepID=A0A411YEC4_9ACTN|nr:alpha/beta hydrolase [Egibacter rhizosphaerae]QBI19540.1 alpha/beta hydrolase [Egibacter rhizosphaerae]
MTADWELTRSFDSEQGEVRWDVRGQGPPVVLVHGTPFSSFVWHEVARALAHRFTVYAYDLAGYGSSAQHDGQDVSLAAQGRVLAALLDHWGLDSPHVVGHDFGGAVALRALLVEQRPYARLALLDAVALAPWGTGFFQLASDHADTLNQLPDPVHEGLVRGYVGWPMQSRPAPGVVDRLAAPWLGERGKAALYRQITQNDQRWTEEVEQRLDEIAIPTLVLWGEEDQWLPAEQGRELAARIPDARFRAIPDADHLVQFDAPAIVAVELTAFLTDGAGPVAGIDG